MGEITKPFTSANLSGADPLPNMVLLVSEFLSAYNEDAFWRFVNSSKVLRPAGESDQGASVLCIMHKNLQVVNIVVVYDSAIDFAEKLLPSATYNAFLFSLSLHTYSPTVQLFHQVRQPLPPFYSFSLSLSLSLSVCVCVLAVHGSTQ